MLNMKITNLIFCMNKFYCMSNFDLKVRSHFYSNSVGRKFEDY